MLIVFVLTSLLGIGISPYKLMFGIQPNAHYNDSLYLIGKKMGFERLMTMTDMKNKVIMEEKHKVSLNKDKEVVWFLPGTIVIKKNAEKNDKLDTNWLDKTFTIIAAYGNNTYSESQNHFNDLEI